MRKNSRPTFCAILTGGMAAILMVGVMGWKPPDQNVETRRLVLQDDRGRDRMRLRMNEEGHPVIELIREDGSTGASLGLLTNGSILSMFDKKDCRVIVQADESFGRVAIFGKEGKHRVEINVPTDGDPTIEFIDPAGVSTVKVR